MPGRAIPLVTDQVYHVFNRGIDHRITFLNKWDYRRAFETVNYYRFLSPPLRLAGHLVLKAEQRKNTIDTLKKGQAHAEIIAYCFMPNHFHFCLKQKTENGISKFMSNFQNSYTRYFNVKHKRTGPLFLDQFKAVRIETDGQLLHISRYIHLNPYSSFVIKSLKDIGTYLWSSYREYVGDSKGFTNKNLVLSFFKTRDEYKKFIHDQADYQRSLESIKHLSFG